VLLMPGPHRFQRPGQRSADALITGLVRLGRTVVTFDPPGSGWSSRPTRLGMPEMLSCTLEALAAAGVDEPVDAVGHSMGGLALLAFTLQHPDLVDRLVLIGTGRGGGTHLTAPGALWNRHHRAFPAVALLGSVHLAVGRLGSEGVLNNLIERRSFVDQSHSRPARVRAGDWLRPRAGRADWHRIARTLDYGPRLPESPPGRWCCADGMTRSSRWPARSSWARASLMRSSSCSTTAATTRSSKKRTRSGSASRRSLARSAKPDADAGTDAG
jgi:pimeloyl-ACP methyl ester carboxylesterase